MQIVGAKVETVLPFEKERVARLLGAPASIVNWHPWVEQVAIFEQQGLLYRKSVLSAGGAELVEKYWEEKGEGAFHYQAVQGLWADHRYRSRIQLADDPQGCKVSWEGRLMKERPEDEKEQMQSYYERGLEGLSALLATL